jgi:multicomponent Na+:H+ antiporter subunit C
MNGLFFGDANYFAVIVLMMAGLYIVYSSGNLIKRMVGLALFQTSTGLFYISLSKVAGGTAPIIIGDEREKLALAAQLDPAYVAEHGVNGVVYSNPLPHVLILTAIVVGVATLAVGLAIVVRLREAYGTIEMDKIAALDRAERAGPERLGLGA